MKNSLVDRFGYFGLTALMGFLQKMPFESALRLGRAMGRIAHFFSGRKSVAYADIKAAFGDRFSEKERKKLILKHYENFGQMFVEVLLFPSLNKEVLDKYIHIHHQERFFEAIAKNKGLVLLTGHFGNWELLQIVSGILGKPINVLARMQKHTRLNELLTKLRESHGSTAVLKGMGIRDLLRSLRRKELIGLLGDRSAGKYEGVILPFFGRKTSFPTGAFDIAQRTQAPVLPCFIARQEGPFHDICVEAAMPDYSREVDVEKRIVKQTEDYVRILQKYIEKYPDQWLWESKRWKYSWTKRILILSDGKPGHEKQSLAVRNQFESLNEQHGRAGMEYPTQKLVVKFKSKLHQRLFYSLAFLWIPFSQGGLSVLKYFLEQDCFKQILNASADFVISAGASLVPLNLCLAKDSRAKSIILMKPPFPYTFFKYDLSIVPSHDEGLIPKNALRMLLTPNLLDAGELENAGEKLSKHLRDPQKIRMAVFLGGPTRRYKMEFSKIESLMASLEQLSKKMGDYVVTTSRRTPDNIAAMVKEKCLKDSSCQMVVIAKEDKRTEIASGMMAVADILIITEDSISMISEGISSGKKVLVLSLDSEGLPAKHRRFRNILEKEGVVVVSQPDEITQKISSLQSVQIDAVDKEINALRARLQEIL